jgi:transposase-like protein
MTHPNTDFNAFEEAIQLLTEQGPDAMAETFRILLNHAMQAERSQALAAQPYERTPERKGHANGFKRKFLSTRMGNLELAVPQVRGDVDFYPSALDKGVRSERALTLTLAEMYIQGVSTRKVTKVLEELCGTHITSAQVSRATAELDPELQAWRNRPLDETPYLVLDARYEKVRQDGAVRSCALLVAIGVCADGKRSILGVSTSLSEAEVHWRNFLLSLKERGLHGVTFVTSDDHEGLRSALKTVFPGAEWQRCQTHLQRNATAYVPKVAMRPAVANDIRDIFNAPSRPEAERRLQLAVKKYEPHASRLALWMEKNIPQGLSVFSLPEAHRKRMRTSNVIERLNKEIKRRTRVAGLFPNEEALLRLVSGVVAEISDDWESGINYLNIKETDSDLPF